jgi:hypothetical protein
VSIAKSFIALYNIIIMSTSENYLGLVAADTPVTISEESEINELIHAMRKRGITRVAKTASRVPCIMQNDGSGQRITHPVLGAGGEGYVDLAHRDEAIRISGQRTPGSGHMWRPSQRHGGDTLRITFSVYHDEGKPDLIGAFVHKPDGEKWAEVGQALKRSSVGYAALHVDLGAVQQDGLREMRLYAGGVPDPTELKKLPFTNAAANILMGQAATALRHSLAASR